MSKRSVQLMAHAGAGVDQSDPSRIGSLIDESRPLQLLVQKRLELRAALTNCGAPAFFFSSLNLLPKIALGKIEVALIADGEALLFDDGNTRKIAPLTDQAAYYRAILANVSKDRPLALVPEYIAQHLKKGYSVAKQHDEYLMNTWDVIWMPGGALKHLRHTIRKTRRMAEVEEYDPAREAEYLALNKLWYQDNAERKFRTYDKTSIDWLIRNWPAVQAADPSARMIGIRDVETGKLVSFNAGCVLCDGYWTAYTRRYDRSSRLRAAAPLGHALLAQGFATVALENNGTADTPEIKANKSKLAARTLSFFTVKA